MYDVKKLIMKNKTYHHVINKCINKFAYNTTLLNFHAAPLQVNNATFTDYIT